MTSKVPGYKPWEQEFNYCSVLQKLARIKNLDWEQTGKMKPTKLSGISIRKCSNSLFLSSDAQLFYFIADGML